MQDYTIELVDLVNEHDAVVTTCARSNINTFPTLYLRIVLIFLVNDAGKLCILRRADSKKYLPSCWALVGGGVLAGESYENAIIRETAEEINVTIDSEKLKFLGVFRDQPHQFMKYIYEININQDLQLNFDDFSEYRWLSRDELIALEASGERFAPDFIYLLNRFYAQ